jgi:ADP-heptose:LPS heptosyltransferase
MQRFLEVAQWLRDEGCRDVIVALGPAELERLAGGQVEALRRDWQVLEAPPLEELAGLVARAGAMVGNDSGPSHLAAAMGCPVVAVFGPTSPAHFAPLGKEVQICQGSRIEDVPVSAVTDAVSQLLGR